MDGCTKPKRDYASLKEALEDYDAGLNVDNATLSRLASQEQGPYECEFFFGAEDDNLNRITNCPKKEYHENFTLLENLTLDSLPREYRHPDVLDTIKLQGALTVKIIIRYVSKDRPDKHPRSGKRYAHSEWKGSRRMKRSGTGMVVRVDVEKVEGQTSGCDECQVDGGDAKTRYRVVVATALHVVYDQSEADQTEVAFSLQIEDGVNVSKTLKGCWNHNKLNTDVATLSAFTDDERLCDNLDQVVKKFHQQRFETGKLMWTNGHNGDYFSTIVSHPHGQAKHVSFGNFLSEFPLARMLFPEPKCTPEPKSKQLSSLTLSANVFKILRLYFGNTTTIYNTPTCPGSSGALICRYMNCQDNFSLHEGVEGPEGFNMAGEDSYLNDLCYPLNPMKDDADKDWLLEYRLDRFSCSLNNVRDSYEKLIAWIEKLTESEVDEIITILFMIVKELDDVGQQASPGQGEASKTGLETIITEMVKIVKNYNDVGLQDSPCQEGASMAGTDVDLQASPGQEEASKTGLASIKDTIRTELVKFLKNFNGEDLLARKVNDTPMKYPTTSGITKIIQDLSKIMQEFNALAFKELIEIMREFKLTTSADALDSDLPAQTVQQRNAKTSGIKKLHRDSAQTRRWYKVILVLWEGLHLLKKEGHLTGSDATLLSHGSRLLDILMDRLNARCEVICRLVEEIQK